MEEIIIRGEKYIKGALPNGKIILKKYYPKQKMWCIINFNEDSTDEEFEKMKEITKNILIDAIV